MLNRAALSVEDRICLLCARPVLDEVGLAQLQHELSNPAINWNVLIHRLVFGRLAALAQHHFSRLPADALPPQQRAVFALLAADNRSRNRIMYDTLQTIAAAAASAGIPVLVLKGFAVATTLYPDPALRSSFDIDILVHARDTVPMHRILLQLGFSPRESEQVPPGPLPEWGYFRLHEQAVWRMFHQICPEVTAHLSPERQEQAAHTLIVEMHQSLFVSLAHRSHVDDPLHRIWHDADLLPGSAHPLMTMHPSHLLFYLCYHAGHHLYELHQLCDIHALITHYGGALDWSKVIAYTREQRVSYQIYYALYFARELLGTPVPAAILAELTPGKFLRSRIDRLMPLEAVAANTVNRSVWQRLTLHWLLLDSWRSRATSLWNYVFPKPDEVALAHKSRRGAALYLTYIGRYFTWSAKLLQLVMRSVSKRSRS